ncbi:MAG: hypothetical protein ACM34H_07260 [Deltaproteobacteria bacterium]
MDMTFTSFGLEKKRPAVVYSTAGLYAALYETLRYVMIRRRMSPMGVHVPAHFVVRVLIMVAEVIRRRGDMAAKASFSVGC